ncbi:hypothetical protein LMG28690_01695 [Paraburkholderia caffeinilytica]|nr:hypothetical protein LMG28690_01695 [Paraburkholderia caffeinilytica]
MRQMQRFATVKRQKNSYLLYIGEMNTLRALSARSGGAMGISRVYSTAFA